MQNNTQKFLLLTLSAIFCAAILFPASADAQRRDYLTSEEIELVRDAQEIDKRIEVLVKAIDRRFLVLNKDDTQFKQVKKDMDKWGELPSGSEIQLLGDIEKIIQKAVDDIDNLVSNREISDKVLRDGNNTTDVDEEVTKYKIKRNKKQFPIAVHTLADAARRYVPMLESWGEKTTDRRAKGAAYGAIQNCELIIEASAKVPRYTKKSKKKKKKDKN